MKCITFVILLIIAFQAGVAQNMITPCKNTFEVDIDNSGLYEDASLIKDSMLKKLMIVFEQSFNDSIYIFCGTKIIEQKKIETDRTLGISREMITIDYSKYKKRTKISIILKNKNDCISFYPMGGKRMAYINVLFIYTCNGQQKNITITPEPVFSEADTTVSSTGDISKAKYDYFLLTGNTDNKEFVKKAIDNFINKKLNKKNFAYYDYLMFFYKETSELNKKTILEMKDQYRYKLFDYKKNENLIACYNFRDSILYRTSWNEKYDR